MTATVWPRAAELRAFFGEPGGVNCTAGLVDLAYPMRIAWDTSQVIRRFRCHVRVEKPLERIFAATLTFAHGLGVVPKVKQAILRCKTADLNYAVGDEIDLRDAYSGATNAAYASGAAADVTNIKLIMRYAPALIDKSAPAGSPANIHTAKWKLVVRAWA